MTRSLGIDIGSFSIKIAELQFDGKTTNLLGTYELPLAPHDSVESKLREFLDSHAVNPQRISVNVGGTTPVLTKKLSFPFGDSKRVEQAILANFEDNIPFDLDEYLLEIAKLGKIQKSHSFMAGLCPKAPIVKLNDLFENLDTNPNAYLLDNEALARLALQQFRRGPEEALEEQSLCVCDIGFSSTKLAFIKRSDSNNKSLKDLSKTLLEYRSISKGSMEIFEWMESHKKMSRQDTEQWLLHRARIKNDDPETPQLSDETSDDLKTALKPILVEIYQTLQALKSKQGINTKLVILTGGIVELSGFKEFFAKELRLETQIWDAFEGFNLKAGALNQEHPSRFSLALGLANRFNPLPTPPTFNFRRSSLADKKILSSHFDRFFSFDNAAVLKGLFLAWLCFFAYQQLSTYFLEAEKAKVKKDLIVLLREVDPVLGKRSAELVDDVERARELFEKEARKQRKNLHSGKRSHSDLLLDISTAMPSEFKVSNLSLSDAPGGASLLQGQIESQTTVEKEAREKLLEELKARLESMGFSNFQQKASANRIRFEVKFLESES